MITLNEAEQRLARFIAVKRHAMNRSTNTTDRKIGPQSNEETDLEGIGAELAFCKLMNVYPDLQCENRPVADATLPCGKTVDVKSTTYEDGKLAVTLWKKPTVDLFALMVGRFPTYRLAGFRPAQEVISLLNIGNLGHGETYVLEQWQLNQKP